MAKPPHPTKYTPELAERLLGFIAVGDSVRQACDRDGMPDKATFFRWLAHEGPEYDHLRVQYEKAKEMRAEARFERLRDIGERVEAGKLDPQAARVAADIEKWCLGRERPMKYGESVTLKGDAKNPIITRRASDLSDDELAALARGEQL